MAQVRPATARPTALAGGWSAALAGVLAGAVGVGAGELAAVAIRPEAAPLVAVGSEVIDRTPAWLKDVAVRSFGTADKAVLLGGILALLTLAAAVVGLLERRYPAAGLAGIVAVGLLGAYAAVHRPEARFVDAAPSLLGAVAGCLALTRLIRAVPAGGTPGGPVGAAAGLGPDRRGFLRTAAVAAGVAAAAEVGGRWLQDRRFTARRSRLAVRLPAPASPAGPASSVDLGVPGASPYVTPNAGFYRVDTALIVPQVPAQTWSLRIHGMVDRPVTISYAELLRRPTVERLITLTCVSNEVGGPYVGTARWLGVLLAPLLREAGVRPGADQLVARSADGMTIGTPTAIAMDGRDAMLALGMNGEPLPLEHGFPVRMVVPGLYGYVSACKWIVDLELTTFDAYDPYWVARGWAKQAPIKTESRIDTPRAGAGLAAGRVAVAGVAWAQHRGIRAVEVRVDGGPWEPARLAGQPTTDAWRQWVYDWDAAPGRHTLESRATDGTGQPQTGQRVEPFPDGATGWHRIEVVVV
ncbi:MAG TPA: molybdopterin-dependent oxidoreductase [Mycobacteriales bacterium]|nr:molybdopterin-dependent oxidoreductase [Mycobacteriales bacterium]